MNYKPFGTLWHHIKACWSYLKVFLAPGALGMHITQAGIEIPEN